jgi:PAS domain-containing protein
MGAVAAMLLLRALLDPVFGDGRPYITLFGAVAFAVWFSAGNRRASLPSWPVVAANYFFVAPRYGFAVTKITVADFVLFALSSSVIIILGESMHRTTERAEQARLERFRTEESERAQKELLRVTLASIARRRHRVRIRRTRTLAQSEAERLTGWTRDEAIGKPLDEVFHIEQEDGAITMESRWQK